MNDAVFEKFRLAAIEYDRRVKPLGSFLDVPDIKGKAQVPIVADKTLIDKVNVELEAAWAKFASTGTEEERAWYFSELRRRADLKRNQTSSKA
jgi:hypothetical protein